MTTTNPIEGLVGGFLIGLGAAVLLFGIGKTMGASGISGVLLKDPVKSSKSASENWKVVFLASMLCVVKVFEILSPATLDSIDSTQRGYVTLAIAGLLVGAGTAMGNGCTSGHGICGLGRLSLRSFVAVCVFFVTAVIVASVTPTFLEAPAEAIEVTDASKAFGHSFTVLLFAAALVICITQRQFGVYLTAFLSAALFSSGLIYSRMADSNRVLNFLNLNLIASSSWDATLIFVMGVGVLTSLASYQYMKFKNIEAPYSCPLSSDEGDECNFDAVAPKSNVDKKLVFGSFLFGAGWGLGGVCPGPMLVNIAYGSPSICWSFLPAYIFSRVAHDFLTRQQVADTEKPTDDMNDPQGSSRSLTNASSPTPW